MEHRKESVRVRLLSQYFSSTTDKIDEHYPLVPSQINIVDLLSATCPKTLLININLEYKGSLLHQRNLLQWPWTSTLYYFYETRDEIRKQRQRGKQMQWAVLRH